MSELIYHYLLNFCTYLSAGYAITKRKPKADPLSVSDDGRDPLSVSPRGEDRT
jgi:hypothetical protein